MKILAWNCCGLGSARAVRALLEVRRRLNPDVLFLSETHLDNAKAENVRRRAGFDRMIVDESDGRSGGLLLLWRDDVNVRVQGVTKNYIDVIIDDDVSWRFTGVYGEPEWNRKHVTWDILRSIKGDPRVPWIGMGDFNEILYNMEKEGGRPRTQRQLQAFHDVLSDCELNDMGFLGDRFTWQRGQILERLDRAVANVHWTDLFPHAALINSEMTRSDHRPIVMDTNYLREVSGGEVVIRKKFEARWLQEDTVEEMVKTAWARAKARGDGPKLMEKVADVHEELHRWDKEILKGPSKRLLDLKKDLEHLRRSPLNAANIASQKEIMIRIELMLEQEEIYWVQIARANWLKHGDRNTSFFHNYATKRKKKNLIKGLVDQHGVLHEDGARLCDIITNYFQTLFTVEVGNPDPASLTDVQRGVT